MSLHLDSSSALAYPGNDLPGASELAERILLFAMSPHSLDQNPAMTLHLNAFKVKGVEKYS